MPRRHGATTQKTCLHTRRHEKFGCHIRSDGLGFITDGELPDWLSGHPLLKDSASGSEMVGTLLLRSQLLRIPGDQDSISDLRTLSSGQLLNLLPRVHLIQWNCTVFTSSFVRFVLLLRITH